MDLLRTISTPHPPPWAGIEPNQLNQPNEASTVTPTCCCYPVGVGSSVPFRPGGAQLREEAPSTNYKQQRQISKTESLSPSPLHSIRFDPPPPHKPKKKKKKNRRRPPPLAPPPLYSHSRRRRHSSPPVGGDRPRVGGSTPLASEVSMRLDSFPASISVPYEVRSGFQAQGGLPSPSGHTSLRVSGTYNAPARRG